MAVTIAGRIEQMFPFRTTLPWGRLDYPDTTRIDVVRAEPISDTRLLLTFSTTPQDGRYAVLDTRAYLLRLVGSQQDIPISNVEWMLPDGVVLTHPELISRREYSVAVQGIGGDKQIWGVTEVTFEAFATAPTVSNIWGSDRIITIVFSEPMNTSTGLVTNDWQILYGSIPLELYKVVWISDRQLQLDVEPLPTASVITVRLPVTLSDIAGNLIDNTSAAFRTPTPVEQVPILTLSATTSGDELETSLDIVTLFDNREMRDLSTMLCHILTDDTSQHIWCLDTLGGWGSWLYKIGVERLPATAYMGPAARVLSSIYAGCRVAATIRDQAVMLNCECQGKRVVSTLHLEAIHEAN